MRHGTSTILRALLVLLLGLAGTALAQAGDASAEPAARALPAVPDAIRDALVAGEHDAALRLIGDAAAAAEADVDFWRWLETRALWMAGRDGAALEAARRAVADHPDGRFRAKLMFTIAEIHRERGEYASAEAIFEAEAGRLLSERRKGELADVYVEFADELSREPDAADPEPRQPQWDRAWQLYARVLDLGAPRSANDHALFRMGQCMAGKGDHGAAIRDFDRYLAAFDPTREGSEAAERGPGVHVFEAAYRLGEAQLASGQRATARRTFEDLARDLADARRGTGAWAAWSAAGDAARVARAELEGDVAYAIARTWSGGHAVETPLGIAARRRFVEAHPDHESAPRASFEIGSLYAGLGRADDALVAFDDFLAGSDRVLADETAREELAELRMRAVHERGVLLAAQKRHAEAIAVFQEYVARFPTGAHWSEAQGRIVDSEYLIGAAHRENRRFADARAAWEGFLEAHPLDGRARRIQYDLGALYLDEAAAVESEGVDEAVVREARARLWQAAIAHWRKLVAKYPGSHEAGEALYRTGVLLEDELGDLPGAIAAYRECTFGSFADSARARLTAMTSPSLLLMTEHIWRTDETPRVRAELRNIEELEVELYELDLEAYFRKHLTHRDVERLDLDLIAADQVSTVSVDAYREFAPLTQYVDLDVEGPGVWVVVVKADELRATTLVLRSDVDVIVKSSRSELFVFAQDMLSDAPAEGVEVLVALPSGGPAGAELRTLTTADDGVARLALEGIDAADRLHVLAHRDGHVAAEGLSLGGLARSTGLSPRGFVYTDRPAYRPGERVHVRAIVRDVVDGAYVVQADEPWQLTVLDPQGRVVHRDEQPLSAFGSLSDELQLDEFAPTGTYRIGVSRVNGPSFQGTLVVEQYRLQPIEIAFETENDVVYRGEEVEVTATASWYYGEPVADAELTYTTPDGRQATTRTDADGEARFTFDTRAFPSEGPLWFRAALPAEQVAADGSVFLAVNGYRAGLRVGRDVVLAGDSFDVHLTTNGPDGAAVSRAMRLDVLRRERSAGGGWADVLERTLDLETDSDGEAHHTLRLAKGGTYVLRAEGDDRFGNPVSAQSSVFVSGDEDSVRLRLFADDLRLDVGERAEVELHNRAGTGLALVTFEGEEVFDYRLVSLADGANELAFDVGHDHFPNFAVSVAMMRDHRLHAATTEFEVSRDLRVEVLPASDEVRPGAEATVELRVTDQLGRPVEAELSLAVVDAALFEQFPDTTPALRPFFAAGARRAAALRTTSSCTFAYTGQTGSIDADVLAEVTRALDEEEWGEKRLEALEQLAALGYAEDMARFAGPGDVVSPGNGMPVADADGFFLGAELERQQLRAGGPAAPGAAADRSLGLGGGGGAGGRFAGRSGRRSFATPQTLTASRDAGLAFQDGTAARIWNGDTAFWTPAVVTDAEGRATLTYTLPERSTRWRLTARGATTDTAVGESTADVVTKAELFVELERPGLLTEGDAPRFSARVHNYTGQRGTGVLRLRLRAGSWSHVLPVDVELAGEAVVDVAFPACPPLPAEEALEAELELVAELGGRERTVALPNALPLRPFGLDVARGASGSLTDTTTVWLDLTDDPAARARELELYLGPGVERLLIEEALGRATFRSPHDFAPRSQADAAGDLLGTIAVIEHLRALGRGDVPEMPLLDARAQGLIARLVSTQRDDGGWSWSGQTSLSDWATSSAALFALGRARDGLFDVPATVLERGVQFAESAFRGASQADNERKAMLQWALAAHGRADFGALNRLHRLRADLTNAGLAFTALGLSELKRAPMAADVASVLAERADEATAVGGGCRWDAASNAAWNRGEVEANAIAVLALARAGVASDVLEKGVRELLDSRPWPTSRARGFALAALTQWQGATSRRDDAMVVVARVGDAEPVEVEFGPGDAGRHLSFPADEIGGERVQLELTLRGRGELFWSAALRGFSTDVSERSVDGLSLGESTYARAAPRYRGLAVPEGWSVVRGPIDPWVNRVAHLPVGDTAKVTIRPRQFAHGERLEDGDDFLVLDVPLPAGVRVLENTVEGRFESWEQRDGGLRFQLGSLAGSSYVTFQVVGAIPGEYRLAPPTCWSATRPEVRAVGAAPLVDADVFRVLPRGAESPDAYRPTPDELFHRGQRMFAAGERDAARVELTELLAGWEATLRDERLRDAAEMLLYLAIEQGDSPQIVRYFEILKEKHPQLTIPFEEVVAVGRAYREMEEHERALLIFRATIEETYGKDLKVAAALEEQGEFPGAIRTLEELWLEFPDAPPVVESYLAVADKLLKKAPGASADPSVARAGLDRLSLELGGILLLQRFLALYPEDPLAPQAGLNMVSAFLNLEDYDTTSELAGELARHYTEPRYVDAFQYSRAVADWYEGRTAEAVDLLSSIVDAEYVDERGIVSRSINRDLSLYILGQIHHAQLEPVEAIAYYEQVEDQFPDAREAIQGFREKRLALPEVTTARPGEQTSLEMTYKNLAEAELLVYAVDLMTLYLREKDLSNVTSVELAGIAPVLRDTVELGAGEDLRAQEREVELALDEPGAYLVIARGEELHSSGLVLVTPLELEVREDPVSGRMRIQVLDHASGSYVRGADVRVIGSAESRFRRGETDPRGLYVADGVSGLPTVIARLDGGSYAFYRGTESLRVPHQGAPSEAVPTGGLAPQAQTQFFQNVIELNDSQQSERLLNWQLEADKARGGVQVLQVQ